ncbi:MAG: hypothetical protein WBO45_11020 [Planctomycetota bacterium]
MPVNAGFKMSVALGDMDDDGDVDIVCGKYGGVAPGSCCAPWSCGSPGGTWGGPCAGQNEILFNLQRQLDAPLPPRIGQPWTIDVHLHAPIANPLALVFLSSTRIQVPLPPYGVLGIVPAGSLPLTILPPPPSVGSTTWNLPNVPSAIGMPIHAQSLFFTPSSLDLLSNVVTTVIQP